MHSVGGLTNGVVFSRSSPVHLKDTILPNSSNSSDVVTASRTSSTCMTASSVPGMSFLNNCTVHGNVTIHIGETSAKIRTDEHTEISQFQPN
jgi:hypothetical protein